jgi:hypothetical protein
MGGASPGPGLTEDGALNFQYLRAVYSLNAFHGYRIRPRGNFETRDEIICAAVIGRGGDIAEMHRAGADPLYCALLSDPLADEGILLKTVEQYIPF